MDEEKALKWIGQGAQPSDSVQRLLRTLGTLEKAQTP
jgi:ribosomal protein S16